MYHRPMFNFFCICLALVHALMLESTAKLGIITGMFAVLALYTILLRPYRSVHSNIVLFVLSSVLLVTCFLLLLKKTGLNSAIFVEDYFYGMLIIVNGFGWFILLAFILLILQTRRQWPVTKETIMKEIQGQDYAIFFIKKGRKLVRLYQISEFLSTEAEDHED